MPGVVAVGARFAFQTSSEGGFGGGCGVHIALSVYPFAAFCHLACWVVEVEHARQQAEITEGVPRCPRAFIPRWCEPPGKDHSTLTR